MFWALCLINLSAEKNSSIFCSLNLITKSIKEIFAFHLLYRPIKKLHSKQSSRISIFTCDTRDVFLVCCVYVCFTCNYVLWTMWQFSRERHSLLGGVLTCTGCSELQMITELTSAERTSLCMRNFPIDVKNLQLFHPLARALSLSLSFSV